MSMSMSRRLADQPASKIVQTAGSDIVDRLDPTLRERMIANGPSIFGHELAMFTPWIPSERACERDAAARS